ncbi:hypothetical protein [Pantoea sp.]|uniref:hypothetical protein n=1 Tax=Pantoea sp. TaxID=69393 RepID=UPI0028A9F7FB|nr:hypothetical protein [Pantoea sp.]
MLELIRVEWIWVQLFVITHVYQVSLRVLYQVQPLGVAWPEALPQGQYHVLPPVMEMVEGQGITMADSAPGRENRVKNACIIPGILSATALLTSVDIFPDDGWMGFLPYEAAKFFVILFCSYGGIAILKDLTLYFIKGKRE